MDILHLAWEYPPIVYGGLGRHVDGLSRAQAQAGHAVTVLTAAHDVRKDGAGAAARERRSGVDVRRVGSPSAALDLPQAMGSLQAAMVRDAADRAPDVVHAHDWMVARAGRAVADRVGCPLVLTVHATELGRRFGRLDGTLHQAVHDAERAAVSVADQVVVCSTAMVDEVERHGARAGSVHVVPGGVEAACWVVPPTERASERGRRAWPDEHLVVAAGRLEWEKGFSTLLRATPGLLARRPRTRVVLAGTGSYEPTLRRLLAELGTDGCTDLSGHLPDPDLARLFAAADAVVVPSRYEPFGLVALEAQSAGAPVVVTRTGGLRDLVDDDVTGRVVEPGDVDRLAEVLDQLLGDPASARRLADAGRRSAQARTWSAVAAALDGVYVGT